MGGSKKRDDVFVGLRKLEVKGDVRGNRRKGKLTNLEGRRKKWAREKACEPEYPPSGGGKKGKRGWENSRRWREVSGGEWAHWFGGGGNNWGVGHRGGEKKNLPMAWEKEGTRRDGKKTTMRGGTVGVGKKKKTYTEKRGTSIEKPQRTPAVTGGEREIVGPWPWKKGREEGQEKGKGVGYGKNVAKGKKKKERG